MKTIKAHNKNWSDKLRKTQIRNRKSYKDFKRLLDVIKTAKFKYEILRAVYDLMDRKKAFHYETHSAYAEESLEQLIKDELPDEAFLLSVVGDEKKKKTDWDKMRSYAKKLHSAKLLKKLMQNSKEV